MLSTGYPGDCDPLDNEDEWECSECQGVVVRDGKDKTKCTDCGMEWEADVEPLQPDY